MAPRRAAPSRTGTGREELSFLADLIGGEEVGSDAGSAAAKMNLNLFGEDDGDAAGGGGGGETQSQVRQPTHTGPSRTDFLRVLELITCCRTQMITIDVGRTATSHVADVMASMSLDGGGGGGAAGGRATPPIGGGDDDDDLLDLLDAAE